MKIELKRLPKIPTMALLMAVMSVTAGSGQDTRETRGILGKADVDSTASPFIGCYELNLGRWWPWAFGEDTRYVTPPDHIELLSERGTSGFEQDGSLVRTIPRSNVALPGSRESSYWKIRSASEIDLIWADGFTGVVVKTEKHGDELRGWAYPHFDAVRLIPRIAGVVAQRIACNAH